MMIIGQDFIMNCEDCYGERSRFSRWQVKIFTMTGGDFHVDRLKFFVMTGQDFIMHG